MASNSKIEWTNASWNPVTGCTKISLGCQNCYAERMARRLKAMGNPNYCNGFQVTLHPHMIHRPLDWKKSCQIFVNSMSDLFHEDVPFHFIENVFNTMRQAEHHIFQILTKRSERLLDLANDIYWPPNVWMGVTIEHEKYLHRLQDLKHVPAKIKFLSLEPLLSAIHDINLDQIDWVIVGGESGHGARLMEKSWVVDIKNQCMKQDTPFFFKQWGGVKKKRAGRILDGRTWSQMPRSITCSVNA